MAAHPDVTVGVISHDGRNVIADCIASVSGQRGVTLHPLLVDVASSDGTAALVRTLAPQLEVLRCATNRGPNPARNAVFAHAPTDLVLLVDDDAALAPDCVRELLDAARRHPDAAAWIPRIVHFDDPGTIQNEGTLLHYVSEAILANRERPVSDGFKHAERVTAATGICMLVSKAAWREIGGFDEDYFFGRTDGEFTTRLTLAGHRIYVVPSATCRHKEKARGFGKLYYQVRNRWYFTLSIYSGRSLLVLAPALLVHELSTIAFLTAKGQLPTYLRGVLGALRNLPLILRKRRAIQRLRRVPDVEILTCGPLAVRSDLIGGRTVRAAKQLLERFYAGYWRLASPLLRTSPPRRSAHAET